MGTVNQQNAAALEILRTEAREDTHGGHLSTWLPRDSALPLAEYAQCHQPWSRQPQPLSNQHQHIHRSGYPANDTSHPLPTTRAADVPHTLRTGTPLFPHHPSPLQPHKERAHQHGEHR